MLVNAIDANTTDSIEELLKSFMSFINEKELCLAPCKVIFLPDNDSVLGNAPGVKEIGFSLYSPNHGTMYIAGDISGLSTKTDSRQVILTSLAHEYIHHIQNVEKREFDEGEADSRAKELVKEFQDSILE